MIDVASLPPNPSEPDAPSAGARTQTFREIVAVLKAAIAESKQDDAKLKFYFGHFNVVG